HGARRRRDGRRRRRWPCWSVPLVRALEGATIACCRHAPMPSRLAPVHTTLVMDCQGLTRAMPASGPCEDLVPRPTGEPRTGGMPDAVRKRVAIHPPPEYENPLVGFDHRVGHWVWRTATDNQRLDPGKG